ncbi:diguanylate cyclase [Undibacterium sp. RuTC16W]|uniref:tetratricopeptide repeat-containing diguanylate cyclase n=1 Tax=Undibacterium sp. RuTC16W TaxID=3413048 RepID=UPI003BF1A6B4
MIRICLTALVLGLSLAGLSHAGEKEDMEQIDKMQAFGDIDNAAALKQFQEFEANLPPEATYQVKLRTLKTMIGLLYDAGKAKQAEKENAALLALATRQGDKDSIAFAQIGEALQALDAGHPEQSIATLTEIQARTKNSSDPELRMRIQNAFAAVYASTARFELALSHYLEALKLTEQQPRRQIQSKLYRLNSIANLYNSMKNPEKALATVDEALKLSPVASEPKTLSSLRVAQGVAFAQLGRNKDALNAYERALAIGREASLASVEVTALGNIADQYLVMQNFVEAERTSRLAYAKAVEMDDDYSKAFATVNWGFALGGQGKIAQGAEKVNTVIAYFEKIEARADLEGVLDELGRMYEKAGMYKEALSVVRRQQVLSNELFRSDGAKAVATLQETFNADQRQKQIELLARENQLKDADIKNRRLQQIITLLGAVVTVMAGIFIFLLYRRVRRANEKLLEANQQLEFHAVRDPLTGLYNRRSFVDLMRTRMISAEKDRRGDDSSNPDCLILMDIDHFKQINDTWGHAVGDSVLMEVAHRLKKAVRDTDMVLRWGGEEFLIYSPKSHPNQLTRLVERVLFAIGEQNIQVGDISVPVTVTAGFISLPFSGIPEEVCNWEKAMQMADMALYLGKAHGRNRAYGLAKLLVPQEQAMKVLDHDLSAALTEGMVELIEVVGPGKAKENAETEKVAE